MATLQVSDIADIAIATQKELGRMKLTDISFDLQRHVALTQMLQKGRAGYASGSALSWNLETVKGDNFRFTGLYDVDNINVKSGLKKPEVPWKFSKNGWAIDQREVDMNRGSSMVVNQYKLQRRRMLIEEAAEWEDAFWGEPASSTDTTTPYGLKYWLVYNATAGFNGGNNTNWASGPAGIDRDTYANFKNYTFSYTDVSEDDAIAKIRKALWSCDFRMPLGGLSIKDYGSGRKKWGIYTTYDTYAACADLAKAQNDSVGSDLARYDGKTLIQGVTIEAVPQLESNDSAAAPIVGLDWDQFEWAFLNGWYMKEDKPHVSPRSSTVVESMLHNVTNWRMFSPRTCFLGAKSTWH